MQKLILASSSPFRRELLSRLRVPFETYSPNIDETPLRDESWQSLVMRLSSEKACVASKVYPEAICIGSDEIAALDGTLLGKPLDHANATQQLKQVSGQKVFFYTGVCIKAPQDYEDCRVSITAVKFRTLTDRMIENYLNKEKPYHSAGSFKSETLGSALIERFEGTDPTAMIGLPLILLCDMLRKAGFEVI